MTQSDDSGIFHFDLPVEDVAQFFIDADATREEPDVTPLKLQKLLYLAQANYLASTGRRLFNAPVEAFEHGPVVYSVFTKYQGKRRTIALDPETAPRRDPDLPPDVTTFLSEVWRRYQDESASQLRNLTHSQAPWKDNWVPGSFRQPIPDVEMTEFFRDKTPAHQRIFHEAVLFVPHGIIANLREREDDVVQRVSALFKD